jgi:hypothetical protein
MSDSNKANWGSVIEGAAIASGAVAAVAICPSAAGEVTNFIAANPLLTTGAAALAGGMSSVQAQAQQIDSAATASPNFRDMEDIRRMESQLQQQMQACNIPCCNHLRH